MSGLAAFWLGIVQGLTEFLPVSSSGHLVILETLLGLEGDGDLTFEVALHAATLIAIAVFYRARIVGLIQGVLSRDAASWRYVGKLALATTPAVAVGLFARDLVQELFSAPIVAGAGLLVTGGLLWTTRKTLSVAAQAEPSWGAAFAIGVAQALAIVPGISRSGTTVAVALALGIRAEAAAEFSFLMGIIAIAGATVLVLPDLGTASSEYLVATAIGSVAALVSGIGAIWLFLQLLRSKAFHLFSFYAWTVGGLFLLWLVVG